MIFYADEAVIAAEGLVISLAYCKLHCYKQVSCSWAWVWWSGLSCRAELCADMSLRINQAYQSDRCLSTCYKHLPRLAPTPSHRRLFTRLQPPYSGPVYSLAQGSNIRSVLCHWFTLLVSVVSNDPGWSGRIVCNWGGQRCDWCSNCNSSLLLTIHLTPHCSWLPANLLQADHPYLPFSVPLSPFTELDAPGCNDLTF